MTVRGQFDRERWLASISEDDIGRFLGFFGRGPWILYALCAVSFTYLALVLGGPSGRSPAGIGVLVLGLAMLLLIVLPAPTPLPKGRTVALVVAVPIIVAVVTWQQPFHDRPPRYDTWELALCDLTLFCLVIRARYLAAWIGMLFMHVTVGIWSTLVTGAPWYGLSFVYTQAFSLLAVTVFAIGLHHTARQIAAHRAAERERAAFQARQSAGERATEVELAVVKDLAGPMLGEISAGRGPARAAVRSLEAALRDLIRGRALAAEPLVTMLRVVRERGADVSVLDDLGDHELGAAERQQIVTWAAAQIAHAKSSALTLRLSHDEGKPTVTLAADGVLVAEYVPHSA
ncbi:hypothetical protein [Microbacterium sp.]|uniref:hypothetical protein n=1 Tax=Microbacterium sp. TaxID=51671 RepID=UPI001ACC8FA4|nr:hypothetical protein [Microbacterium sp.]MBN9156918.1 hypothetical protein [Microbacterium sp.]